MLRYVALSYDSNSETKFNFVVMYTWLYPGVKLKKKWRNPTGTLYFHFPNLSSSSSTLALSSISFSFISSYPALSLSIIAARKSGELMPEL